MHNLICIIFLLCIVPFSFTAITPRTPFITKIGSSSNFEVPLGYSGLVLTCTAEGWPMVTVEWFRGGESLISGSPAASQSDIGTRALVVSARLVWLLEVSASDAGSYTCVASNEIQEESRTVTLRIRGSGACSVSSSSIEFQLRLLNTECVEWSTDENRGITDLLVGVLIGVIEFRCPDCGVTREHIRIAGETITCSSSVAGAALVKGRVSTGSVSNTEEIFCVVQRWLLSGPTVTINGTGYLVDTDCPVRPSTLSDHECSTARLTAALVLGIIIAAGMVLLTVPTCIVLFMYWYLRIRKYVY